MLSRSAARRCHRVATVGTVLLLTAALIGVAPAVADRVNPMPTPSQTDTTPSPSRAELLPPAAIGRDYHHQLDPTATLIDGDLPDGLGLDPDTGLLTGIPTEPGEWPFTLRAPDGEQWTHLLRTGIAPTIVPRPEGLPGALIGVPYTATIEVAEGPLLLAVSAGALPEGLTLDPVTGEITGTPVTEQTAEFTLAAETWAGPTEQSFSLRTGRPPSLGLDPLPSAVLGAGYRATVVADGSGPVAFAAEGLPPGLTLDPDTGELLGAPTESGTFTLRTTATSWAGVAIVDYALTVWAAPHLVTELVPGTLTGADYATRIEVTGDGPLHLELAEGALPAGLHLDSATGVITGAATEPGDHRIVLALTGPGGTDRRAYTLPVRSAPEITTATLPDGVRDQPYRTVVRAVGEAPRFTVIDGALPAGLTLDPTSGAITGTPTAAGWFGVRIEARSASSVSARIFTGHIWSPPELLPGDLPGASTGQPYRATLLGTGDGAPVFRIVAGGLPPELTLDPSTGTIAGTPTAPGDHRITVALVSAHGKDQRDLLLTIRDTTGADRPRSLAATGATGLAPLIAALLLLTTGSLLRRVRRRRTKGFA